MTHIEHIGIAVKNLSSSIPSFEAILNTSVYKQEEVATEGVKTAFLQVGINKIELLESTEPGGIINKFIEKRGEGIHHIAFSVADIYAEMDRLRAAGFTLLSETPKKGADNKLVCFIHPKNANGVLIEICQEIK